MWEQIRSNRRKSAILILLMGGLLGATGYSVGVLAAGPEAGVFGFAIAAVIFLVQMIVYYSAADSVLLAGMGAREATRDDSPRLFNIVEEMKLASGLDHMPRIYLIDEQAPNAFAIGRNPENSAIAVTTGLLYRLRRDELQGVIAHEIGHIRNRDVQFMTLAAIMLGTIVILSEMTRRMFLYGGRSSRRSSSRSGDGGGQAIVIVIALLVAILGPIAAQLLYFASSRRREHLADASAAQFTRYPEGLASALEKIERAAITFNVSQAIAPMFIVNPLALEGGGGFFSTHPSTTERVGILRSMAGASFADYNAAAGSLTGKGLIGRQTLAASKPVSIRKPSDEGAIETRADARATIHRLLGYCILHCTCGMDIKVPELFESDEITCIRCGALLPVPAAKERLGQYLEKKPEGPAPDEEPLKYTRRGTGWESFRCKCGGTVQLSPGFSAPRTRCSRCGRTVEVS
jgi:heat shock protein HtpX